MTAVPAATSMPECNGSVAAEKGPFPLIGVIDEAAKSAGTVPYANAAASPEASPAEANAAEDGNSLPGHGAGEEPREATREENDGTRRQGPAGTQDPRTDGWRSEEGPGSAGTSVGSGDREPGTGTAASPGGETPTASADRRGNAAEEEEEEEEEDVEEEEEDTEEDEVQVIEIKQEHSETSCLKQQDGGQEAPAPTSPGCDAQLEKPGEQPSLGKKNDISRHSYSRYNTISYRRIRKGNTKQRIDEFESMMHL